jgi:hypothetical protein
MRNKKEQGKKIINCAREYIGLAKTTSDVSHVRLVSVLNNGVVEPEPKKPQLFALAEPGFGSGDLDQGPT